jgi:hydroxyacylglutathione hydrolase
MANSNRLEAMVQVYPVPAFKDNYLWVAADGPRAAVVDPGDSEPIERFLAEKGLELTAILATHHHGDHVGGLKALAAHWRCPVFGPAHEAIEGIGTRLAEGDRIRVPGLDLALGVLDVPGHTSGHIAYVRSDDDPLVFCGDTLFACGCGRLFEGSPAQMSESLAKLARLPDATRVYCAHEYTLANIRFAEAVEPGNARLAERKARDSAKRGRGEPTVPSTIGEERATNPFLRCGEPEVIAAAERHAGRRLDGPVEVFAEIREWKNTF